MNNFNIKYQCDSCGKVSYRSLGGYEIECTCGGMFHDTNIPLAMNDTRKQIIESPAMLSVRKECLSHRSRLMQHIYHCKACGNIHVQNNYDKVSTCSCSNMMLIELTIHNNIEYDGQSGIILQELFSLSDNTINKNIVATKRKILGISQSKFGSMYGISQSMVAKLENGTKKIPADLVIKLS